MANTDVSIVNNALLLIGDQVIVDLTDATNRATIANAIYAVTRDAVLSAAPWNFAIKRAALVAATAPVYGWTASYTLPTDCLNVIALNDDQRCGWPGMPFRIESGLLLTDEGTADIRYVSQVTDPSKFEASFVQAFIFRLASAMAYPITGSTQVAQQMWALYEAKMKEAQTSNAQEGTPDSTAIHDLINVR